MIRRMAISSPVNRRPNVPLIILGAVLALLGFVSVLLIGQGGHAAGPVSVGTNTVVVAAHDITARTVLSKADLTTAPMTSIPGAVVKVDDAVGMAAQIDIKQGQPVLAGMLTKSGALTGNPNAYLPLPKGFVAFTLPTNEQLGVAGYVQTGDYIDIVAVVTRSGGAAVVRTIYSSVHVIRVGAAPAEQSGGGAAPPIQVGGLSSTITVAVSECQAEYLTWFVSNAQLRYTLLSTQDASSDANTPDTSCPAGGSAKGITDSDVRARWPGLA